MDIDQAIKEGNVSAVRRLIVGRNVTNEGYLGLAISHKQLPVIEFLLRHGASPSLSEVEIPLQAAVAVRSPRIVRLLLQHGAVPQGVDEDGISNLDCAVAMGERECVALILAAGGDPHCPSWDGLTPIDTARRMGRKDLVYLLENPQLAKAAADRTDEDVNVFLDALERESVAPEPRTPTKHAKQMIEAAQDGKLSHVLKLIAGGANPNAIDEGGHTPLFWAANRGRLDVVERLIAMGAQPDILAEDRSTALLFAAIGGYESTYSFLKPLTSPEYHDSAEEERRHNRQYGRWWEGPPSNEEMRRFITLCARGAVKQVEAALGNGVSSNSWNDDGSTAILSAVVHGKVRVVRLLLLHGAEVNQANRCGHHPLERAALKGSGVLYDLLFERASHAFQCEAKRIKESVMKEGKWK